MKILFAASECNPFIKTGGLADVVGSLPQALAALKPKNSEVVVVLPKYSLIDSSRHPLRRLPGSFLVPVGDRSEECTVWISEAPGRVSHYFLENRKYFHRPGLYQTAEGDFEDNDERFIFFSRAVLELCKFVDFVPDVIHAHDWQAGLISAYLKTVYRLDAFFHRTATVFTIHNIAYQGSFPKQSLFLAGFSWREFTPERLEYYQKVSFLKAGLVYSDKVSTVSPTYAQEVQKDPEFGRGLEGVLRARAKDFTGILNGLDYSEWDPAKDKDIAARYSLKTKNFLEKKELNKKDLQIAARLPSDPAVPLVGMVSRLDVQKGFELVVQLIPSLFNEGARIQWVILGSGDKAIKEELEGLAKRYPKSVSAQFGFSNDLAHKIYAGSDFFLMPSLFEPCGLSQMIAMRYGTPPVVTPTGGLLDTVTPFNEETGKGTGFLAERPILSALREALLKGIGLRQDRGGWEQLARNAMSRDFSWKSSAQEYWDLYEDALKVRKHSLPSVS